MLRENDLAIMPMTTSKVTTATLRLLVITCIIVVAVRVTEATRELDNGVGGVLLNREQLAICRYEGCAHCFPGSCLQAFALVLCHPVF